jgi:hypothetical protein
LVLVILAVIWAAVLLPPWLQRRSESRPADSITSFRNQLSVLERRAGTVPGARMHRRPSRIDLTTPSPTVSYGLARPSGHVVPPSLAAARRAESRRRRRDVFFTLAGAAGLTLVLALVLGGPVWALHLAIDVLLGGYVLLLVQVQQRQLERDHKVRYLAGSVGSVGRVGRPEPALLSRSAN